MGNGVAESMIPIMTVFGPDKIPSKVCSKCNQNLPLSQFSKNSGRSYLRSECKECTNKLTKQIKEYKKISIPKDYICPICLKNEEACRGLGGKKAGTWCVDHNHITGEFRGWLCHSCNRTIGNFHDDVDKMQRAIDYLKGNSDE